MMGRILLLYMLMLVNAMPCTAQAAKLKPGIPPFTIQLTDRSVFSYKSLSLQQPVILIYFAPGCDHCRVFISKLMDNMAGFRHTQIILISYYPLADLQQFSKELKLQRFPHIKTGTEGNAFVVPAFFKIGNFPFTAVYGKGGMLTAIFRKEPSIQVLLRTITQP